MKFIKSLFGMVLGFGLTATSAFASSGLYAGEKVFKKCEACHVVDAKKHKTGPYLVNIMGRAAGSVDGYKKYSKAMKSSGIVWNDKTLDRYLEKPKAYVKGTRMVFAGLRREADRASVIAYLKSYSK